MRSPVLLITAFTPAVWGTTYAVTTEFLPPGRPLLAGVLRALPAGLLLLALTRQLPRGSWWWRAAVLGGLNIGVFFALLFVSAYRLPGGMAAVLGAAQPLIVAGLTTLLLTERVALRTVLAGLIGAGGVALTVLTAAARLDAVGLLAGLTGTASMALGLVLTKRWGRPGVPLLTSTGWQLTAGGLLLAPVALLTEGLPRALTAENLAGYAYLSMIGTALAYTIWFWVSSACPPPGSRCSACSRRSWPRPWAGPRWGSGSLRRSWPAWRSRSARWCGASAQRRSAFSRTCRGKPTRATRSMARPSRSVVVTYLGAILSSKGTIGAVTV